MIHSLDSCKARSVEDYTAAGFTLFPLQTGSKKPVKGWQATKYDPELSAEELPEAFGVLLAETVLVLDVDPRRYVDGVDQLEELVDLIGCPLDTFIVRTGGGGFHLYLKAPKGIKYRFHVKGFPAIECKSLGRFVAAAGSVHPSTRAPYVVENGSLDTLLDAPQQLLNLCQQTDTISDEDLEDDSQEAKDKFIRFCLTAKPSIQGDGGDQRTYTVACSGRDFGLSEAVCLDIMGEYYNLPTKCKPVWDAQELATKVRNAYTYAQNSAGSKSSARIDEDVLDELLNAAPFVSEKSKIKFKKWDWVRIKGVPTSELRSTLTNTVNYFLIEDAEIEGIANPLKGLVGYNEMNCEIEFLKPAPWHHGPVKGLQDSDVLNLKYYLSTTRNYENVSTELCREAFTVYGKDNAFHPLRNWLDGIIWDRIPRVDTWIPEYLKSPDTDYERIVGRNALLALVARAYKPGCQYDYMVVLEGRQGSFKSTALSVLGGEYYRTIPLHVDNETDLRRTVMKALGGWVIEVAEMAFVKKQEVDAVKAFVTTRTDTVVLPYAHFTSNILRPWALFGTINPGSSPEYLADPTGGRRFLPVKTGEIDIEALKRDRNQLFAEAVYRFKRGEKWHDDDVDFEIMAREEQEKRAIREDWTEVIGDFLEREKANLPEKLNSLWIANNALAIPVSRIGKRETNRIGKALKDLGYVMSTKVAKGQHFKTWIKEEDDL